MGVVLTEEAAAEVLLAEAAGVSLEGILLEGVGVGELLSLLLLLSLVAGACEVGAGSSEVGAGSSVVEAGGAAEDAGGALDAGGGDDVSGAAEGVGDGVGVGVGELLPVPWAWRFSFWWRYSLMPSMCRPSKLKAEAMATRASRANNHVWRIMVSVSMSMSMSAVDCRNGRLQIKRRRMGVGQIRCG